jgi:hypothetical protein
MAMLTMYIGSTIMNDISKGDNLFKIWLLFFRKIREWISSCFQPTKKTITNPFIKNKMQHKCLNNYTSTYLIPNLDLYHSLELKMVI